jgi:hypothetical protein
VIHHSWVQSSQFCLAEDIHSQKVVSLKLSPLLAMSLVLCFHNNGTHFIPGSGGLLSMVPFTAQASYFQTCQQASIKLSLYGHLSWPCPTQTLRQNVLSLLGLVIVPYFQVSGIAQSQAIGSLSRWCLAI